MLGGEAEQVIRADLTNGARIGAAGAGGTSPNSSFTPAAS